MKNGKKRGKGGREGGLKVQDEITEPENSYCKPNLKSKCKKEKVEAHTYTTN